MIEITEETEFIGEGANKKCFLHPADESRCIKVLNDNPSGPKRTRREIAAYKKLQRNGKRAYLAQYLGTEKTTLGKGYVFEYIPYKQDLSTFSLEELEAEIQSLYEESFSDAAVISDLHADNLAIRENWKICIIDGLGSGEFIPLPYWIPYFARKKLNRKFSRLAKELKVTLEYHEVKFF